MAFPAPFFCIITIGKRGPVPFYRALVLAGGYIPAFGLAQIINSNACSLDRIDALKDRNGVCRPQEKLEQRGAL